MEELELKIIRALNENSRKSFREIAKKVGTSAPVVINKIKRLEALGAIKGYIPVLDPEYFGYTLMAVVTLRISHGKLLAAQQQIAEDPHTLAVYDVTGDCDSIVIAHFKGRKDLNNFIKKINAHKNVDRTVTHIVLNIVKDEPRLMV